jgi:hypothetical protein
VPNVSDNRFASNPRDSRLREFNKEKSKILIDRLRDESVLFRELLNIGNEVYLCFEANKVPRSVRIKLSLERRGIGAERNRRDGGRRNKPLDGSIATHHPQKAGRDD